MGHTGGFLCFEETSERGGRATAVGVGDVEEEEAEAEALDMVARGKKQSRLSI